MSDLKAKMHQNRFRHLLTKIALPLKKVCYKVSLCEKCKAIYPYINDW